MTTADQRNASAPASTPKRRGLTLGLAGGLVAGTAAGLVFGIPGLTNAASDTSVGASSPTALVEQAADPAGDSARPAPGDRMRETLQSLVDEGTITAEQADAVVARLVEDRPDRGDRGDRGRPGHRGFGAGVASEALTDLLGLDAQDLHQQLRDGATLAEIATAQGIDTQAVVDELVGELSERLDQAVENGRIEQTEADEKLADVTDRIADVVDNGRPERQDRAPADADPGSGDATED